MPNIYYAQHVGHLNLVRQHNSRTGGDLAPSSSMISLSATTTATMDEAVVHTRVLSVIRSTFSAQSHNQRENLRGGHTHMYTSDHSSAKVQPGLCSCA